MSSPLSNLDDELCLLRMDCLTLLGKNVLPKGIWGDTVQASGDQESQVPARQLFLTFDDGPCPQTTPRLLEVLEEEKITATFFLLGSQAAKHPDLVEKIAQAGHSLGNHTYHHLFMPMLSNRMIEDEIGRTNNLIKEAAGAEPTLFRPPFGLIDGRAADCLRERQMTTVYWGAVAEDWMPIGSERVVSRVMKRLGKGNLIVLHEGMLIARQTVDATRQIIKRARAQGYSFERIA